MSPKNSSQDSDYDPEVFLEQFSLAKRFIYHLTYYRLLRAAYTQHTLQSEFWTHTIDAHLLQASINWCMIFGSHGCNPTHWKKLSPAQSKEIEDSFRNGLARVIRPDKWEQYWMEMTDFRNNYAAHRAIGFNSPVPNFDLAVKVVHYYDGWVREIIKPDDFPEPSLEQSAERVANECIALIDRLMKVTMESQKNSE